MAQQVKDPLLSLGWFRSLLWYGFNPWLWNIQINQRKKKRERKEGREGLRKKCKHVVTEWNGNIGYMVTGSKLLTPTEGLPSPR